MTVGIIMGSKSDWPTMKHAAEKLTSLVWLTTKVVSAPYSHLLADYASKRQRTRFHDHRWSGRRCASSPERPPHSLVAAALGVPVQSRVPVWARLCYTHCADAKKALPSVRSPLVSWCRECDYLPHQIIGIHNPEAMSKGSFPRWADLNLC